MNFRRLDPGNYPQDFCPDRHSESIPTVNVVDDDTYGKVWQVHKPLDRKRAEFARTTGYIPKEGDDVYIAWRWKIESTPKLKDDIAVWQWKSQSPHNQNYPLNLDFDGKYLTLNAFGPDYLGGKFPSSRKATLWAKQVPQNEWMSFVVRIKMSKLDKDAKTGFVEFWFNGEKQSLKRGDSKIYFPDLSKDLKTAFHRTLDGDETYAKWGSYNKNACKYTVTTRPDCTVVIWLSTKRIGRAKSILFTRL